MLSPPELQGDIKRGQREESDREPSCPADAETDLHWPLAIFLKQQAPKHRKVANVREVKDNSFVQRRRAGERVADTRHLKSSPRDLGKTRVYLTVLHGLPCTWPLCYTSTPSHLSYHRPSQYCSGCGTRGPRRCLSGCQGASEIGVADHAVRDIWSRRSQYASHENYLESFLKIY